MANLYFTSLVIIAGLVVPSLAQISKNAALRRAVFGDYDKLSNPDGQTDVKVLLTLLDLKLCPHKQVLKTDGWIMMMWTDSRLSWDPKDWGGLDSLRVHGSEVWLPDVTVYNVAGKTESSYYDWAGTTNAVVLSTGMVIHVPPIKFKSFCEVNYDNWPWGEQNCTLKIGSWTYDQSLINIQPYITDTSPDSINTEHFANNQIKILRTNTLREEKTYPCCPDEIYPNMHFSVAFQRTAKFQDDKLVQPV